MASPGGKKKVKMIRKILKIIYVCLGGSILFSCSTQGKFAQQYYTENEATITRIEQTYNTVHRSKPLAAEFSDAAFEHVRLEMKTDSLRYIYEFNLRDQFIKDTLFKYGYDTSAALKMLSDMKRIKCTWINILDYYVDRTKRLLVFMSIRPKELDIPFSPRKYFILTFYKQPQYYDEEGRLLDKRNLRRIRKVNNEQFWRINDRVCYTLSDKFR
jgi:hypothetical protein